MKKKSVRLVLAMIIAASALFSVGPLVRDIDGEMSAFINASTAQTYSAAADGLEWSLKGVVGLLALLSYQYVGRVQEGHHLVRTKVSFVVECDAVGVSVERLAVAMNQNQASLAVLLLHALESSPQGVVNVGGLRLAASSNQALEAESEAYFELDIEVQVDAKIDSQARMDRAVHEAVKLAIALYTEKVKGVCEKIAETGSVFRAAEEVVVNQLKAVRRR